jgi:polar amino acid transport system substrate-binding protein
MKMSERINNIAIRLLVISVLLVIFGLSNLMADEVKKPNLIVATDASYPPMEYINNSNEIIGFDIDLINAVAKAGGFTVEIVNDSFDYLFSGLKSGKYDAVIAAVSITEERQETMDFSIPYVSALLMLAVKSDTIGIEELSDLSGTIIAVSVGGTAEAELRKLQYKYDITIKSFLAVRESFEAVMSGTVSAAAFDAPSILDGEKIIKSMGYGDTIKIVEKPFADDRYGIAIAKGNAKILDLINAGLQKVIDSGMLSDLKQKWLR